MFKEWVKITAKTKDGKIISDSLVYLKIMNNYYGDYLAKIGDQQSVDARIAVRYLEGIRTLENALKEGAAEINKVKIFIGDDEKN